MIASQSLMTNPSNPCSSFSQPVTSSVCACIFPGSPTPSSVQSTLENDGMTVPARYSRTAGT